MSHNKEWHARWYAANAERKRAQVRARYRARREEILEADRRRRAENADQINRRRRESYPERRASVLAQVKGYQARNSEAVAARRRARYRANAEMMRAKSSRYRKINAREVAARNLRRVALMRQAIPNWFGELDRLVEIEAQHLSKLRERCTGFEWHVDHMIPMQARDCVGLHVYNNLQVIPAVVNIAKGNRMILTTPGEWIRHI